MKKLRPIWDEDVLRGTTQFQLLGQLHFVGHLHDRALVTGGEPGFS